MSDPADRVSLVHARFRERLRDELVATMSRLPLELGAGRDQGVFHDDTVARTTHFLRSLPMEGKHIVVGISPRGPWKVGRVRRGDPAGNLVLGPHDFGSYVEAVRFIQAERYAELLGRNEQ